MFMLTQSTETDTQKHTYTDVHLKIETVVFLDERQEKKKTKRKYSQNLTKLICKSKQVKYSQKCNKYGPNYANWQLLNMNWSQCIAQLKTPAENVLVTVFYSV